MTLLGQVLHLLGKTKGLNSNSIPQVPALRTLADGQILIGFLQRVQDPLEVPVYVLDVGERIIHVVRCHRLLVVAKVLDIAFLEMRPGADIIGEIIRDHSAMVKKRCRFIGVGL